MLGLVFLLFMLVQRGNEVHACLTGKSNRIASSSALVQRPVVGSVDGGYCAEKSDRIWFKNYLSLLLFRQRMGHCDTSAHANSVSPQRGLMGGFPLKGLDRWIRKQRAERKLKSLSQTKVARLGNAGLQWDVPSSDVQTFLVKLAKSKEFGGQQGAWKRNYLILLFYRQAHGHCNVATMGHRCEDKALGRWVRWQREAKKFNFIRLDRQAMLDGIGFEWQLRTSRLVNRGWDARFADLVQYKTEHGDCAVQERGEIAKVCALGRWVTQQRIKHKTKQLGFIWDSHVAEWEANFRRLMLFRQQHGHGTVYVSRAGAAGRRFAMQRVCGKDPAMDSSRRTRLDSIGFCWDAEEAVWRRQFAQFQDYVSGRNSAECSPPVGPRSSKVKVRTRNPALWLKKQAALRRKGELPVARERLLEEMGVDMDHDGAKEESERQCNSDGKLQLEVEGLNLDMGGQVPGLGASENRTTRKHGPGNLKRAPARGRPRAMQTVTVGSQTVPQGCPAP